MNIITQSKMAVEIKKSVLAQQVQDGWKKQKLADYYNLPMAQMTKVLQEAGLKIRKFHAPKFDLVDDTEETTEEVTQDVILEAEVITEDNSW